MDATLARGYARDFLRQQTAPIQAALALADYTAPLREYAAVLDRQQSAKVAHHVARRLAQGQWPRTGVLKHRNTYRRATRKGLFGLSLLLKLDGAMLRPERLCEAGRDREYDVTTLHIWWMMCRVEKKDWHMQGTQLPASIDFHALSRVYERGLRHDGGPPQVLHDMVRSDVAGALALSALYLSSAVVSGANIEPEADIFIPSDLGVYVGRFIAATAMDGLCGMASSVKGGGRSQTADVSGDQAEITLKTFYPWSWMFAQKEEALRRLLAWRDAHEEVVALTAYGPEHEDTTAPDLRNLAGLLVEIGVLKDLPGLPPAVQPQPDLSGLLGLSQADAGHPISA